MAEPDVQMHAKQLASELLADIELTESSVSQQVLKAVRLARLVGDSEAEEWLDFELNGIPRTPAGRLHMTRTNRWTKKDEGKGYWSSTASDLEGLMRTLEETLKNSKIDSLSGDYIALTARQQRDSQFRISTRIAELVMILNRIRNLLHDFARRTLYELEYSSRQQSLFEAAQSEVDGLLAPTVGRSLEKIDSIYRRLSEGDPEAISQAMNTCRRLIDSFADAVYPASDNKDTIELDGEEVQIGPSHTRNRIRAFVADHVVSQSHRKRLRQSLTNIYERVSAAVHDDVTSVEARFLFLSTYVLLGEVLMLSRSERVVDRDQPSSSGEPDGEGFLSESAIEIGLEDA